MEKNENGLNILFNEGGSAMPHCDGTGGNCRGERQLAFVYSPINCFRKLYSKEDALMHGTLFMELDKPLEVPV